MISTNGYSDPLSSIERVVNCEGLKESLSKYCEKYYCEEAHRTPKFNDEGVWQAPVEVIELRGHINMLTRLSDGIPDIRKTIRDIQRLGHDVPDFEFLYDADKYTAFLEEAYNDHWNVFSGRIHDRIASCLIAQVIATLNKHLCDDELWHIETFSSQLPEEFKMDSRFRLVDKVKNISLVESFSGVLIIVCGNLKYVVPSINVWIAFRNLIMGLPGEESTISVKTWGSKVYINISNEHWYVLTGSETKFTQIEHAPAQFLFGDCLIDLTDNCLRLQTPHTLEYLQLPESKRGSNIFSANYRGLIIEHKSIKYEVIFTVEESSRQMHFPEVLTYEIKSLDFKCIGDVDMMVQHLSRDYLLKNRLYSFRIERSNKETYYHIQNEWKNRDMIVNIFVQLDNGRMLIALADLMFELAPVDVRFII